MTGRPSGDGGRLLETLARSFGVQTSYRGAGGARVRASNEAILAALRSAGAPVERVEDVAGAHRERLLELWRRVVDLVVVAWDGTLQEVRLRAPASELGGPFAATIELEEGGERSWHPTRVVPGDGADVDGTEHVELVTTGSLRLPLGYHRLHARVGRREATAVVISAPRKAPAAAGRSWGVFLPLHALRTGRSWGVGDLSDLGALAVWTAGLGGRVVATLPILSSFLEGPMFDPSPYSPVSRLFWNELFLDVTAIPGYARSPAAQAVAGSRRFRRALDRVRAADLVDHREAMSLKRQILEVLVREGNEGSPAARRDLRAFVRSNPRADDYARFRAACELERRPWWRWPEAKREGRLPADGGLAEAHRYHLFAQWLAERQVSALARRAGEAGAGLYFDLPIGVSPAGYDVWREREAFVRGASTGAPPDAFFAGGQDWGFPPPHPERMRRDGHRYLVQCLRHVFRHAAVVRVDHAMGLHRLYWIPHGFDAAEGLYVRYPTEELYAVLALEAHRSGTVVVGEDLGTVPHEVRRAMGRRGVLRSHVVQLELPVDPDTPVPSPPRNSVATLDTHDLPPFAAFWGGDDIGLRERFGWLGRPEVRRERRARAGQRRALVETLRRWGTLLHASSRGPGARQVLGASLRSLAESEARMVVVNLEDLWLDPRPQNVPGATAEYPNWRRRARYPFEAFRVMPEVVATLREVAILRDRPSRRPEAR